MKMKEYNFSVRVRVPVDETNVKINKANAKRAIEDAVSIYQTEMSDGITLCGDWQDDSQFIASVMEVKVK